MDRTLTSGTPSSLRLSLIQALTLAVGLALGIAATATPALAQPVISRPPATQEEKPKPATQPSITPVTPPVTAPATGKSDGKDQASLPIKRITLYRSGVGSFERRGLVEGDAQVQLRFNTDQINDILKSMVVLDLSKGKGSIEGVSYGSKEPLARRLSSFGIDISDNPAAGEILSRLRGTPVRLTLPDGAVTGTIMNVETRPTIYTGGGDKSGATKFDLPWINLLTEKGVRSFNLTTASGFEILDANLAKELNKALAALAEHRADRTKAVDVNLRGEGARDIVVAYVQEAPVWKTSYRLVLPDLKAGDAKGDAAKKDSLTMQGWAIVENTTDEDWSNVKLSLVSGRPVSFRMDLYEPLYVFRPEVPVPTVPGVLPREYAASDRKPGAIERMMVAASGAPTAAPAMKMMEPRRAGRAGGAEKKDADAAESGLYGVDTPGSPPISSEDMANYAARSQAQGKEVGEVFQYELENPVTVERQRSAMLPILSANLDGRRVSIYNAADSSQHPMRGIELTNSSGMQFMPGPISVFDSGSYAGDAQIGHVPAGDKRLLAYSVDLDVNARQERTGGGKVRKVRIVKGLFEVTSLRQDKVKYTFDNKDQQRSRTIIIEHPRFSDWKLAEPKEATETTDNLYRFEVSLDAAKAGTLTVMQERTEATTMALSAIDLNTLMIYSKEGEVSPKVFDAFKEAARKQAVISDTQREIAQIEAEKTGIDQDQARIRQNMNGIDRQSQLYSRYMQKLTEQETRLEAIAEKVKELRARLNVEQADLDNYISSLNVE